MSIGSTGRRVPARPPADGAARGRRRDSNKTRLLLLDAAFRRFAADGYAGTTVRDIAVDAGVNVALINRYFTSKEGLFEACLQDAIDELRRITVAVTDLSQIPDAIVRQDVRSTGRSNLVIRLLLRSTGEPRIEQVRFAQLRAFSEHLAAMAGWNPLHQNSQDLLLRAQLVLALSIGLSVLRASLGLEPLASATEDELASPVGEVVRSLLRNS